MLTLERLQKERDLLMKKLREEGVCGVSSVSIGGKDGKPILVVGTNSNYQGNIPSEFNGFSVIVKEFGHAYTTI